MAKKTLEIADLLNKPIIGWMEYNRDYTENAAQTFGDNSINKRCYIYPRYINTQFETRDINSEELFPERGSIEIALTDGQTAETVYSKCGSLVEIRINEMPTQQPDKRNKYRLLYNSNLGKTSSQIWIEPFSGKGFCQVIDVNSDIAYINEHRAITYDNKIYTTTIILKLIDGYYGPFKYKKESTDLKLQGDMAEQYYIAKFPDLEDKVYDIENGSGVWSASFVSKVDVGGVSSQKTTYDWIEDENIITQYIKLLQKNTGMRYTKAEGVRLRAALVEANKRKSNETLIKMTPDRKYRMMKLVKNLENSTEPAQEIIKVLLEDEETKAKIAEYAIQEHYNTIESYIKDSKQYTDIFNKAKEEAEKTKAEAKEIMESAKKAKKEAENVVTSKIAKDSALQKQEQQIKENEARLKEICEKLKIAESVEQLKEEFKIEKAYQDRRKKEFEEENQKQEKTNKNLKDELKGILNDFGNAEKLAAEQLKNSYLSNVMRSLDYDAEEKEDIVPFNTELLHEKMSRMDIIQKVTDYITTKAGREVTQNEVANYLICMTQSFITTFAGNPGTGKTSLCNILANAIGLNSKKEEDRRYIELSVERGWTSHKDYVGYYNPLSKQVEKSNYEMYHALEVLDAETDDKEHAPYVVLLDEANLSPLEHYWAPFLKMCDYDTSNDRKLSLGGKYAFHIPDHMRFLATVNFDHTTEELSPRFLDRSFIITLNPSSTLSEVDSYHLENEPSIISFNNLQEAFMANEEEQIDDAIAQKWSTICTIFQKNRMNIMPRNQKMVQNYCMAACGCMTIDTPTTKYAPLDYAVSQKILPTISGMGENYKKLVDQLLEECEDMPLTKSHLERIKNGAEDMGFYQFFSR